MAAVRDDGHLGPLRRTDAGQRVLTGLPCLHRHAATVAQDVAGRLLVEQTVHHVDVTLVVGGGLARLIGLENAVVDQTVRVGAASV